MSQYAVILFDSTHDAIRANKILREKISITLIPTPRIFSTSCGIALRFAVEDMELIRNLVEENQIEGTIKTMLD